MRTTLLCLAATLLLASCAPKAGDVTKVVGRFADDAPEIVEFTLGDGRDTTVLVKDGRFELEIPKDLTTLVVFQPGDYMEIAFLPDGTTITLNPEAGTAVSSDKNGPQARYAAYVEWMDNFISDYRAKMAEFGEDDEAAEQYFDELVGPFNDYQKEVVTANSDNIVGLMALSQIITDDAGELLALLDGFSDEIKALPDYTFMREALENPGEYEMAEE